MEYLSIADAARSGRRQDEFFQNVRRAVIPRLVERGVLAGRTQNGELAVANDAAFAAAMRLGIEPFVYNQQGWSFVAISAPLEAVAEALRARPAGVLGYEARVKPRKLGEDASVQPDTERRHVFLVKLRGSAWPVLIQTVHWFQASDALLATLVAAELSAALRTRAVAAWDDDFSGSSAIICDSGERTRVIDDESDTAEFYGFFYEQGIAAPECFIAIEGDAAELLVAEPEQVERADRFVLPVPAESQVRVPHVFEKLNLMGEALADGLDDEASFRSHMNDSLWQRVQALRKEAKARPAVKPKAKPKLAKKKPAVKPQPKRRQAVSNKRAKKPAPRRRASRKKAAAPRPRRRGRRKK